MLLATLALVVYVVCGRDGFHGIDAHYLLWRAHSGAQSHPYHTFYLPTLALLWGLAAPMGATLFQSALLLSALGAAVAVWCVHRASVWIGLDRSGAAFAAILFGSLPAVAFFGTTVEVHGLAFAAYGVAWLTIARWSTDPRPLRAALVGFGLVLAFLAHPSAAPLGASMAVALPLVKRDGYWRPLFRDGSIALAVLVAGIVSVPALLRALGLGTDAGFALGYLTGEAVRHDALGRVGRVVWSEWLLGLFPTAFLLLVPAWGLGPRVAARMALVSALPFVVIAWLMLEDYEYEYGAYTAAIAWPTVAVVAKVVRRPVLRALTVACAVVATIFVGSHCSETPRAFQTAQVVESTIGTKPSLWLIGDRSDLEAWLVRRGDTPALMLSDLLVGDATAVTSILPLLDADVARRIAGGEVVFVTDNAFHLLEDLSTATPGAPVLARWLEARVHRSAVKQVADDGDIGCYPLSSPR